MLHFGLQPGTIPDAILEETRGLRQGLRQSNRCLTLSWTQIYIARAHGQPIGLADGRATDHLDGHPEVVDHALDDLQLLIVFLPEIGAIRVYQMKQLADDRRHSTKMPRPRRTFEDAAQGLYFHHR